MKRRTTQKAEKTSSKAAKTAAAPVKRKRGRPPKRETETPQFPGARVIKKYGNRRMYDHTLSRAVTMEDLAQAVRKGEDIRVLDGDTGADLTKRVLVQIILEEGNRAQLELLPIEFLRKLIMLRSEPLGHWMEQYLTAGSEWLGRQMNATGSTARVLRESMESLFPWMVAPDPTAPPRESDRPPPADDLREQVEDLQRRLGDLTNRMRPR